MKYIHFTFLLCLLTFVSCDEDFFEQVVEVEIPEHTPALAVTANFLATDTELGVYISNSVGILDKEEPQIIEDATVELFKNGSLLHTLPYVGQGIYGLENVVPLGNDPNEYLLKVSSPAFETATGIQKMPVPVNIFDASFELEGTVTPDGDRVNEIIIEIDDPEGIENFYTLEAIFEISEGNDSYSYTVFLDSFNPLVDEGNNRIIFSDASFDGQQFSLNLYTYDSYPQNAEGVKLHINLISLSKDRYFFEKSLRAYENTNDNPFAEPTVVHNNIENGHGIFTLTSRANSFVLEIL